MAAGGERLAEAPDNQNHGGGVMLKRRGGLVAADMC